MIRKMREAPEGAPPNRWTRWANRGTVLACKSQNSERSLANPPADMATSRRPVSVASTPRGGASCDDEAMRLRRTVGVGYRARSAYGYAQKRSKR